MKWKKAFVITFLVGIFIAIGGLFWYNELIYQLPTPVPKNYKAVARGTIIKLSMCFQDNRQAPLFLHFFNPDCPCSRFNIAQFKSLVTQYGGRVHFAVVVMSDKTYTIKQIQEKLDMNIPVFFNETIAKACGVYSTPQAVLLDNTSRLYYRGNYNSSRYCTNPQTSYAKIAIEALLNNHMNIAFSNLALKAYGCSLPNCTE